MRCAAPAPPSTGPALLAAARPPACGGKVCPALAGAGQECAGLERPAPRARALRGASKAAAVALHAALLLLAVFLEALPEAPLLDAPLVCTLDLESVLPVPAALAACPVPLAPASRPEPKPLAKTAPQSGPKPRPFFVPEDRPISPQESLPAAAPQPAAPVSAETAAPVESGTPVQAPAGSPGGPDQAASGPNWGGSQGKPVAPFVPGGRRRGFELSEVDAAPRLTRRFDPEYPYFARSRNLAGTVTVRFLVDEEGRVDELTVVRAEPEGLFEHSVLKAVRRWRFKPGMRAGQPAPTWMVLPVRFDLTG